MSSSVKEMIILVLVKDGKEDFLQEDLLAEGEKAQAQLWMPWEWRFIAKEQDGGWRMENHEGGRIILAKLTEQDSWWWQAGGSDITGKWWVGDEERWSDIEGDHISRVRKYS